MARKRNGSAEERKKEQLAEAYGAARARIGFADGLDPVQQAKIFIKEGVKVLTQITDESNAVIESDYGEVKDVLGLPVSRTQYKECVDVMSRIKAGEYTEKNKERYAEQVEQKRYDGMLRETFLERVIDDGQYEFPVPTMDTGKIGDVVRRNLEPQDDREFGEVFMRSVERIRNIRELLQAEFNLYADAFTYIMERRYSRRDFKKLVDWAYFEAGVTGENSAPKLWNDIYRAWDTIRLAKEFRGGDYDDFAHELGLDAEMYEPHPSDDHRGWWRKNHWELFTKPEEDD